MLDQQALGLKRFPADTKECERTATAETSTEFNIAALNFSW